MNGINFNNKSILDDDNISGLNNYYHIQAANETIKPTFGSIGNGNTLFGTNTLNYDVNNANNGFAGYSNLLGNPTIDLNKEFNINGAALGNAAKEAKDSGSTKLEIGSQYYTDGKLNAMGYANIASTLLSGLTGLSNAYTGYKAYKLAKEQFAAEKGFANRNLFNQSKIINNTYDTASKAAAGVAGSGGMVDPNVVAQYAQNAKEMHVDGSPIA
jgi:hypothetical protein